MGSLAQGGPDGSSLGPRRRWPIAGPKGQPERDPQIPGPEARSCHLAGAVGVRCAAGHPRPGIRFQPASRADRPVPASPLLLPSHLMSDSRLPPTGANLGGVGTVVKRSGGAEKRAGGPGTSWRRAAFPALPGHRATHLPGADTCRAQSHQPARACLGVGGGAGGGRQAPGQAAGPRQPGAQAAARPQKASREWPRAGARLMSGGPQDLPRPGSPPCHLPGGHPGRGGPGI